MDTPAPAAAGMAPPPRPPWPTRDRLGLRRCVGYRADGPQGRVGTVEDVRIGSPHGEPEYICIRTGPVSGEQLFVALDDVIGVDPAARRVHLRKDPDVDLAALDALRLVAYFR